MPEERARSPPHGGGISGEGRAEESAKTVYFVPIYAVAVVDPNKHGNSRLPIGDQRRWTTGGTDNVGSIQGVLPLRSSRGKAAESEEAAQQKRQKLILMKKRGRIPEYDDDDPHKPTPKRLRNRMKAQKSRDKKKAYMNSLENKVKELEKMNSDLEERCISLQVENETIRNEVLVSDAGAKVELLHYYEKLQNNKENIMKSIQDPENGVQKFSDVEVRKPEKPSQITDHEDVSEAKFDEDENISVAELDDEVPELEKYTGVNVQEYSPQDYVEGTADKFSEIDEQDGGRDPCPSEHY